jgi:hypothetical protein
MSVKKHMIANVSLLEGGLSLTSAMGELRADYGVVVEGNGTPVAVVTAKELKAAKVRGAKTLKQAIGSLPIPLIIGSRLGMPTLVRAAAREASIKGSVTVRARATVVLDREGVAGVIRGRDVVAYIRDLPSTERPKTKRPHYPRKGDPAIYLAVEGVGRSSAGGFLGGRRRTKAKVVCAEPGCEFVNEFFEVPIGKTIRCKNPKMPPHDFKLAI